MLTTGFVVGILAYFSLGFTFTNLPPWMQFFAFKHHLFTEFVAALILWGTVSFLTHSLIALIALFVAEALIYFTLKFEWSREFILNMAREKHAKEQALKVK